MNNKIYLVMYSYYSDWEIYGYFTNREDADKYCVAHKEQELYVKEIECYNNIEEDFKNVSLKYTHRVTFFEDNDSSPRYDGYDCYEAEFLKSNYLESHNLSSWIRFYINTIDNNKERVNKIACDLYYQYLDFCNKKPSKKTMLEFNCILNKDERERIESEKQEKIKQKELAELKRLKEKYEYQLKE